MTEPLAALALALAGASLAGWAGVLLAPGRGWRLRPVAEDEPRRPAPSAWPAVCALVPARNEAAYLGRTLPALLAQDYPGRLGVVLVDDRSSDGTGSAARSAGGPRLAVVEGAPLPAGWAGKVWALEQALAHAPVGSRYLLLTDADVGHAPCSLRRLVEESEADGLALNSRMARLRCRSAAERLLVPAFLFFFNCLYPMRLASDPDSRLAAAAGGCVLIRRDALERAGGFAAIRAAVIDDVALAAAVKRLGEPVRLAVSRSDVESLREHATVGSMWRTIRRTAYAQLRYSPALLALTLAGLFLLFVAPPLALAAGASLGEPLPAALGAVAWTASAAAYLPSVRFFGLPASWSLTLPLAGLLYGGMTLDSGLRGRRPGYW